MHQILYKYSTDQWNRNDCRNGNWISGIKLFSLIPKLKKFVFGVWLFLCQYPYKAITVLLTISLYCILHPRGLFYNWRFIPLNILHLFRPPFHHFLLWQLPIHLFSVSMCLFCAICICYSTANLQCLWLYNITNFFSSS